MSTALALPDDPAAIVAAADNPGQAIVVLVERAKSWLVEATHVEDVMVEKARAEVLREYAVQARLGEEAVQAAKEIVARAVRRQGELLAERETAGRGGDRKSSTTKELDSLAALGISKKESAESQKLAAIPEPDFDEIVEDLKSEGRLSRAAILSEAERRKSDAAAHREWFNGMAATLTPEQKAQGKRSGELMAAIRDLQDVAHRFEGTTPEEVKSVLDATFEHVSTPLRQALVESCRTIAKFAKAAR